MRKLAVVCVLSSILIVHLAEGQVRGRGRLQGVVTDKNSGKPVVGATVTLSPAAEKTAPIVAKTDRNGKWSALGLTSGAWNIDIVAEGYEPTSGSAAVSEMQMAPPIKTAIVPAAKREETVTVPMSEAPLIPSEAADAINEAQSLLRLKAGDVISTVSGGQTTQQTVTAEEAAENAKRAIALFEKALPLVPDVGETREVRSQLLQVMAQAYYKAGDLAKAIATLSEANARDASAGADPAALAQRNLLLVNLHLEQGDLEKGKALLETLPPASVTDPVVYSNIGILFLNKQKPADALTYFTRAVDLDPKRAESYYYRGLALLQLQKNRDARADFEKVVALAPESPEAKDARQYLASLK